MAKSVDFYVYAYLREDGTPYYIGKGCDDRAWNKRHRINLPKDRNRIIMLETCLTELGALALERRYILWYGRKDCNTGILHNRTDGGEGFSGMIISEETKKKMSISQTGKIHSEQTKQKMSLLGRGRKLKPRSKKHSQNIADALRGRKATEEHKNKNSLANTGKILSHEHKQKISKSRRGIKFSDEHKNRISAAMKGKKRGPYKTKGDI